MSDAPRVTPSADELSALALSAELSTGRVEESAWMLHRWLRQACPHDAIAVTVNGSGAPVSHWCSPTFEALADWSPTTLAEDLGRPIVAVRGDVASATVTILVVPAEDSSPSVCLEGKLLALARVLAAHIGGMQMDADTARLSLAHAVAGERARVTQELTDHFAQYLHTIVNHLGADTGADTGARVQSATSVASRALVQLRGARLPVRRQAWRLDETFRSLESDLGELARAAGIQLERTLVAPEAQILPATVLDAAASITRAAMLNVVEHAAAARARIDWRVDAEELVVSVVDDGRGFDSERAAHGGLGAMRRRAEFLGGSFQVASTPSWGTRVVARLPLRIDNAVPTDESATARISDLGDRELVILGLLAVGHRNREIASELFLSPHTVKFHVGNIFDKLGVRSRAEAAAVAFAAGLNPAPQAAALAA